MIQRKPIPNNQEKFMLVNFKNQEGCVVLDLKSGLPITRRKVTDIPVKRSKNKNSQV